MTIAQLFDYKVRNEDGELLEGVIEGKSKEIAGDRLKDKGYYIISLEQDEDSSDISEQLKQLRHVKTKDLASFCRQFATMINSGLSLVRSLDILVDQIDNPRLQGAVEEVQDDVESGLDLSTALGKHPNIFPKLFISMVEAGETGGVLDEALLEMAEHFEKESEMKQQVTSALVYPAVITLVAIGVVTFLVVGILPTFESIFAGMDRQLPLPTRILLQISDLFQSYWYIPLILIGIILFISYRYYRTENGKRKIDYIILKMPIFGDLITKITITRFSRTLGTLLNSGVSILEGLEVVSRVVSNQVIVDEINRVRQSVSEGENMVAPLKQNKLFPEMALQMIRVGEETGTLDEMLKKIAHFYEQEVEHKVEWMVSLIEPVMILVLGVVVGGIVISMMLPMFDMMQGF
ncbi:type II secretion system F family protein [Selenihalanaerobacter shriftii]|uniref:Type IV pilus assembly protein PilC n=1 Tax=Selenihalanaerobacter shriftii TaxID=142842 RepID=A0A1T4P4F3_9FIRM|nr:type II secretion system F family protein [Selenihalanaerobacter shriftii]SJZ86329.1 type IV pilus assembly protein PilC [Selenihalanaerobacter shriftii]